jgi:hypothetical protein
MQRAAFTTGTSLPPPLVEKVKNFADSGVPQCDPPHEEPLSRARKISDVSHLGHVISKDISSITPMGLASFADRVRDDST